MDEGCGSIETIDRLNGKSIRKDRNSLRNQTVINMNDSSDNTPLFDMSGLTSMFGDDEELVATLISKFQSALLEAVENLKAIPEGPDRVDLIRLHTHTIKGMSANFGAQPLHALSARAEAACLEGHIDLASNLAEDVLELANRTLEAIRKAEQ